MYKHIYLLNVRPSQNIAFREFRVQHKHTKTIHMKHVDRDDLNYTHTPHDAIMIIISIYIET